MYWICMDTDMTKRKANSITDTVVLIICLLQGESQNNSFLEVLIVISPLY